MCGCSGLESNTATHSADKKHMHYLATALSALIHFCSSRAGRLVLPRPLLLPLRTLRPDAVWRLQRFSLRLVPSEQADRTIAASRRELTSPHETPADSACELSARAFHFVLDRSLLSRLPAGINNCHTVGLAHGPTQRS